MTNLDELKGEPFVEDAVDLGTTRELHSTDLRTRTFNCLLKVLAKLGDHSEIICKYSNMILFIIHILQAFQEAVHFITQNTSYLFYTSGYNVV